jgi:hypothetical protein
MGTRQSKTSEQYSEDEADRRFREAIHRAVTTPHIPRAAKQKSKVIVKGRKKKA